MSVWFWFAVAFTVIVALSYGLAWWLSRNAPLRDEDEELGAHFQQTRRLPL